MEKLKTFFWLCSGAHIATLQKCPSESSKYVGIGATIFFTGVFAAFAAGYALFTVFDNVWIAGFFGLVWGLMIFNLDRYIVSSMRKSGNFNKEFKTAIPRIILAILISIVIAKPLEMKIFEKEIGGELAIMEQEVLARQEGQVRIRHEPAIQSLMGEIEILKAEILVKEQNRNELRRIAQEEADGTGGTQKRNAGPIYQIKKADADRVEQELQELSKKNNTLISEKLAAISRLDGLKTADLAGLENQKLDGPASRMEALSRLAENSWAIWIANWFIMFLFIMVETSPVLVKLISGTGPYDNLLKIEEYGFATKQVEELAKINAYTRKRSTKLPNIEKEYVAERLEIGLLDTRL